MTEASDPRKSTYEGGSLGEGSDATSFSRTTEIYDFSKALPNAIPPEIDHAAMLGRDHKGLTLVRKILSIPLPQE